MSGDVAGTAPALGVILAGGRNRRYAGSAKALELVAGEAIVARAIRAMRAAADHVVLVANDLETYRPLGLETRRDLRPGLGALGGILTAVAWAEQAGCRGALVAACDMPFLSSALLRQLAAGACSDEVVAPESGSPRGLEPLCAFYGVRCRPAIEAALERGERQVISFFGDVRVRVVASQEVARFGDPALLFLNVNTPQDREAAEAAARRERRTP